MTSSLRPLQDRTGVLSALGLLGLVVFLFHDIVFTGRVLYEWDIHLLWHAQAAAFARALAEGSLPLWNPHASFGLPMLADPNSQVFYPPTWLLLVVSPLDLHGPLVLGHLLWSAAGAFWLFRRLGLSAGAAFTGAGCWTASGPLLSLVPFFNHFASAAWIPWVLLAAESALETLTLGRAVLWGGALALQLFAGSPDYSLLTGLLCAGLVLQRLFCASSPHRAHVARAASVAFTALVLLSAALWVPAVELARRSTRWGMGASAGSYWSFHPLTLLETIVPVTLWRLPLDESWRARLFESRIPFLHSAYLGLPALVLVAVGLLAGRTPQRRFMTWSGGLALLFAFGRHAPFHAIFVTLFPPLGLLRYPEKALVIMAFAWAFLAGAGIDAWRRARDHRRYFFLVAGLTLAASALLLAAARSVALRSFPWPTLLGAGLASAGPALQGLTLRMGLNASAAILMALLAIGTAWGSRRASRWGVAVAAAVAIASLALAHQELNPGGPREIFTLRPAPLADLAAAAQARLWVYDYFGGDASQRYLHRADPLAIARQPRGWSAEETAALAMRNYLFPPSAGSWNVRGSFDEDFSQVYPRPLEALVRLARRLEGTPSGLNVLRLGAVTHVLALHDVGPWGLTPVGIEPSFFPEELRVFRVPEPLPRARLVGLARGTRDPGSEARLASPEFDPATEVVLDADPTEAASMAAAGSGAATILADHADRLRIETTSTGPAWLVLADTWDPGWRATVDGVPARMLRANLAFRAIRVPAGRHVVEQLYRPRSVLVGAGVSALAWALALLVGAVRLRRGAPAR